MSSEDLLSKLQPQLRELLVASVKQDQQQLGISEKDKADIAQWIEKAAQPDFARSDALPVCRGMQGLCHNLPASFSR
jgi:aminoacyl tRNA synthase complex-interacting multifunctional protein 1